MRNTGIIGYANNSGIGNLIYSLKESIPDISGQFVVKHSIKDKHLNLCPAEFDYYGSLDRGVDMHEFREWYLNFRPGAMIIVETPFNWEVIPFLKDVGCKVIYAPMLDSYSLLQIKWVKAIDQWLAFNNWTRHLLVQAGFKNVTMLPVPINTHKFYYRSKGLGGGVLLHHAGYLGVAGRKGTKEVLRAFENWDEKCGCKLILYSQMEIPFPIRMDLINKCVEFRMGEVQNPVDMFVDGDVYVAPSKKEGIGLPILEAMSCGYPVLTTNAFPMNEYIDCNRCLVSVVGHDLSGAMVNIQELWHKMVMLSQSNIQEIGERNRRKIEQNCSYDVVRPMYQNLFRKVIYNGV